MIKSIKRMVLTGAAVMVMMSFAAPAMAQGCDSPFISDFGFGPPTKCYPNADGTPWDSNVYHPPWDPCNLPVLPSPNADPSTGTDGSVITIEPSTTTTCTKPVPQE
jgi:hypothetical protein